MKKNLYIFIALILCLFGIADVIYAAPVTTPVKQTATVNTVKKDIVVPEVLKVSPLAIVANPQTYLNKSVTFSGKFVSFTSLGLDYKPAFRDGTKYIGILMQRSDVDDHTIPLSELKMFIKRDYAKKFVDIDLGDTFSVTGKIFSTALGDPWMDITEFKITNKLKKETDEKIDNQVKSTKSK